MTCGIPGCGRSIPEGEGVYDRTRERWECNRCHEEMVSFREWENEHAMKAGALS